MSKIEFVTNETEWNFKAKGWYALAFVAALSVINGLLWIALFLFIIHLFGLNVVL